MAGKDDLDYEDMLEVTYEALEESGFRDIRVTDAEDLPEPEAVEGHIPDMQATNQKGITYLFEVCPPEVFAEMELVERLQAFTRRAKELGGQVVLIVPEGEEGLAAAFVEEHELPEDRLTIWEA
ncbi:hypothetical protein [Nitratidesulfovibrio vulgaris]|jgi:hypothetical protein|uniref:Uncharacterized protein n=2 Tax=Nitratidesulfovibrio vulgaris TaxID=881 RepID=Q72FE0_NITV2|nr:hypothetical protein [Nitratidesulfovibrio vulgaris]GEB80183.1 hypothetical protein DDE01_15980 [Desulfovibrio desulfuricans]HBW16817.1 hypothetical protein [Desulfovibrio sp.]AAS94757.1 hypothetical protein DVU_0274 [Nitratidesulfovibrio vulgaris str. Hildenborough]ABM29717.1 conserved hypothetical protein [Nitratidesulfovibrio vulgaris DP4]ADP85415.1 hypothetical protein Deval_0244 [Nitratidesulfovibrio vulgaris RCH1]